MQRRPPTRLYRSAKVVIGCALVFVVTASFGAPSALALFGTGSFNSGAPIAPAQNSASEATKITGPGVYPCSVLALGTGTVNECHLYEIQKDVIRQAENHIVIAFVKALMTVMTYMTQKIAENAAQWVLRGGKGGVAYFWSKDYGEFLNDVVKDSANTFVDQLNDYAKTAFGFNLCTPLKPLDLQLAIGIQANIIKPPPVTCGFQQIRANFENIAAGLTTGELLPRVNASFKTSQSDLSVGLKFHQLALAEQERKANAAILSRIESKGFKQVTDFISGRIKTPAQILQDTISESNALKLEKEARLEQTRIIAQEALILGVKQLPLIAGSTFLNTLAVAAITKLNKILGGLASDADVRKQAGLLNPDAQSSAEGARRSPLVFSDIVTANVFSQESQDFVTELSSCPTPRGLWGCSMDEAFSTALRLTDESGGFTIARAAGVGGNKEASFLHLDWELIPETNTKDNQDPGCYQRAYCASNLAKLRYARILPVGWEFAANSPFNTKRNGKYITLGEVIRDFTNCNVKGELDPSHPWCKLIDPSWVLTAPPFQCRVKGFGETVYETQFPTRVQECSDAASCLRRNDRGECIGGYGSCLSERTVWRFGADACEERYVSCRTYARRTAAETLGGLERTEAPSGAERVSLLRNTIDYGSCNAENVGCMFYATTRDTSKPDEGRWKAAITPGKLGSGGVISGDRTYFDASIEPCDASQEGCTSLFRIVAGAPALNLIENSSFETTDSKDEKLFDAWKLASGTYPRASSVARFGSKSAEFSSPGDIIQTITVAPLRNYVLSVYARKSGSKAASAQLTLELRTAEGKLVSGSFYRSDSCRAKTDGAFAGVDATGLDETWKRFTCEFVTNTSTAYGILDVKAIGEGVLVDGLQLEEAVRATEYIPGFGTGLAINHLKLSPEELGCAGNAKDRKECANYARVCQQVEAGCQGYTDAGGGDVTEIPSILTRADVCPNECVGYAEYRKLPSAFDLTRDPIDDSITDPLVDLTDETIATFIPKNAKSCTVENVGCEEFTNVEAAAAGGETKGYFNYIRACEKPNANTRTYFTWEGSDTTGYQLRTWSLIRDTTRKNEPPKALRKAGPDGIVKNTAHCTETKWKEGQDPDCRQFYDENGNVSYRFFSQTIVSTPECRDYRKSKSSFNDCDLTDGTYAPSTGDCVYSFLPAESASCSADAASCRAYIGTTGRNSASVFRETFAGGTLNAAITLKIPVKDPLSTEALTVGDKSLKLSGVGSLGFTATFPSATGSIYTVSFWAKTTEVNIAKRTVTVKVDGFEKTVVLEVDWKRYEIGPFTPKKTPRALLEFTSLPNVTFIDEINIQRQQDAVYVKKDSWTIPAVCDETIEGIPQPRAMLGCREYRDRNASSWDVRQFSRLCRFEKIGCTAFVDTRNSASPYAQSFVLPGVTKPEGKPLAKAWDELYAGTVTTTRPADRYVYLIDEPSVRCNAANASCRAFGKPKFTPFQTLDPAQPFETTYLKDDITKYVSDTGELKTLCRPSELFCEKFTAETPLSGTITSYFRDPKDHICEWQQKITLNASTISGASYPKAEYSGWFVKGAPTPTPCYPEKVSRGNTFLSEFAGSDAYRGWTASCPEDQSECTEFRDPNDASDPLHARGKPYYFINNERVDRSRCGGKVDLLSGCALFRDMSDSRLLFNTQATYQRFRDESQNPVAPVNCATDTENATCKKFTSAGRCTNLTAAFAGGEVGKTLKSSFEAADFIKATDGASCAKDTDCSDVGITCNPIIGTSTIDCREGDKECMKACKEEAHLFRWEVKGNCLFDPPNDANLVLKVKLDRDCATWLGCSSGETVYDAAQGTYVDLCTNLAVCDQTLGTTGKNFCAHYIDRDPRAIRTSNPSVYFEPILREGRFFDLRAYMSRSVGFGLADYSGNTIPNRFQTADLVTRRVGYELLVNRPSVRDRYITEYRLVAAVPLYTGTRALLGGIDTRSPFGILLESPTGAARYTDSKFSHLNLCQHKQTGQIGYYVADVKGEPTEKPARCYLAIDTPYTQNVADVFGEGGKINPRNAQLLAEQFEQLAEPKSNQSLSQAFPPAECKAYPDAASPFSGQYVKEWDLTSDPPKPRIYAPGYENAPYCEYGEDCACMYRKVSYGGATAKYYAPFGQPPPAGICVGGTRAGEACVPDAITANSGIPSVTPESAAPKAGEETKKSTPTRAFEPSGNSTENCGPSGVCQPIESASFIRGLFGQCLQRDFSRTAGSRERNPCLVWSPSPILFGQNDVYHYQPTAGYLPPQNAGEYYCIAGALPPRVVSPQTDSDWFVLPGSLSKFHFDEDYISDGECFLCEGSKATFFDGAKAKGGDMGNWCEDADDFENAGTGKLSSIAAGAAGGAAAAGGIGAVGGAIAGLVSNVGHMSDIGAGRWIMTGRGFNQNYVEYFIGFNKKKWVSSLFGGAAPDEVQSLNALNERNFSYFTFAPIDNPNGRGFMGCAVTPEWVDGVAVEDYDDGDELKRAWKAWLSGFNQNFTRNLTPDSAGFLIDSKEGKLVKTPCVYDEDNPSYTGCFIKYWQLDYRAEGEEKFLMQDSAITGARPWMVGGRGTVYPRQTIAQKSFFSIRAVFEDSNRTENAKEPGEMHPNKLAGPFRFIGWWVTASVPGTNSERALYLSMSIGHADICREVAQVVSPDSRQDGAFTDRIWSSGQYGVPLLGYVWGSTNPPFGSALHTRPIGTDTSPLFQTRGRLPGIGSKLKPPTFVASGLEYYRPTLNRPVTPTANWAWLTNIFARVYRVYRYYDRPVSDLDSFACIEGPRFGAFCPDPSGDPDPKKTSQEYCGFGGKCNEFLVDQTKALARCNALSGVNAGLPCANAESDQVEGYHVCHNAPMKNIGEGNLVPQYVACQLNAADGWKTAGTTHWQKGAAPAVVKQTAFDQGAFVCASGAIDAYAQKNAKEKKLPQRFTCRDPGNSASRDCPLKVVASRKAVAPYDHSWCDDDSNSPFFHRCRNGYEHAQCTADIQCEFTEIEWWGRSSADVKEITKPGPDKPHFLGGGYFLEEYGAEFQCVREDEQDEKSKECKWDNTDFFKKFAKTFTPFGGKDGVACGCSYGDFYGSLNHTRWWTSKSKKCEFKDDFNAIQDPSCDYLKDKFPSRNGKYLHGGGFLRLHNDEVRLQRYPGTYIATHQLGASAVYIPGHCENVPNPDPEIKKQNRLGHRDLGLPNPNLPYPPISWVDKEVTGSKAETFPRYIRGTSPEETFKFGACDGGVLEGRSCIQDKDCKPPDIDEAQIEASKNWCKSVGDAVNCYPPGVDLTKLTKDQKLAFNFCIHPAGYTPRADLCGNTLTRKQCLTALTHANPKSIDPRDPQAVPPTDVTAGLYTPRFLATAEKSSKIKDAPDPDKFPDGDYKYISYYTPRPPTIAAPDTSRQCPSSGSCPISQVNNFTLENQSEGTIAYVGGQAVTNIRFYGWAAHNQSPLKDLWLDWGDGITQEFHDARMKNKKPFCGVTKECQLVPGLTCRSDGDCPPGGGKCLEAGFCKAKSHVSCVSDADCNPSKTTFSPDKCVFRQQFGNSEEACEQNYFEFTHAYTCGADSRLRLPTCNDAIGRCLRNNDLTCGSSADCGVGDRCLKGVLAPTRGCYDPKVAACRFTPRVLLKDNWGWCTGECRAQNLGGGKLGSGFGASNNLLIPNGGCYDATGVYQNTNSALPYVAAAKAGTGAGAPLQNLCDPLLIDPTHSPWIVFNGSLQLGITQ